MTTVGPLPDAAALGDDVADCIDAHVLQADALEPLLELGAARGLLERRRGDLRQLDLLLKRPGVVGLDDVERGFHARIVRRNGRLRGERRGDDESARKSSASGHDGARIGS